MSTNKKIIMMCGKGVSSGIVFDTLIKQFHINKVIVEDGVPTSVFLKRRIKRVGLLTVLGQVAFMALVAPVLRLTSKQRIAEILHDHGVLDTDHYLTYDKTEFVSSVNSEECIRIIKEEQPHIVVVNGTRIISKEVLQSAPNTVFVNIHAGITPKYRGCHGAYWAAYNQDTDNMGVTVHLIDPGIDTGGILYQERIGITSKDNFITYPFLQTCVGAKMMIQAINDICNDSMKLIHNDLPSGIYQHPTILQYLWRRIKYKVK